MKVWSRGLAGTPNTSYHLSFVHLDSAFHTDFIHMGIEGSIAIFVLNNHQFSSAFLF